MSKRLYKEIDKAFDELEKLFTKTVSHIEDLKSRIARLERENRKRD